MSPDISQFDGMSVPQKLQLVEILWDEIAASNDELPLPNWHIEELDRRELSGEGNSARLSWDEVKRQIRDANG